VGGTRWNVGRRLLLPPRLISALLLIIAGWLIYWFINADLFYIRNIQVEGDWRLSEAELLLVSGLDGINVFWTDTQAAARAIEALPDVQSAQVRCRLPANCVVKLVERPVSLVWRQGDAEVWIGADGVVVPARGELPNAIVLDAAGSAALKPGNQFDPTLLTAIEELERLQPSVRVYQYSDRFELGFENQYGWSVRLGSGEEIGTKLALSRTLTDYLLSRGVVPRFIDVRYPATPYYGE
jgi:cell division septal protein FtsQ